MTDISAPSSSRTSAPAVRLITRPFLLLTGANLFFFTGLTLFFTLPVHMEDLGASRGEVGRIMGAFGVASMFGIPATGVLVDRFGRRPFLLFGTTLWVLLAAGFVFVDRVGPLVYMLRLLQGAAFAMTFVAVNTLVADLAPPGALGRAIAIFGTTTLATHALGPALGEIVSRNFGFAALYSLSGASALCAVTLFGFVQKDERSHRPSGVPSAGLLSLSLRPGARSALMGGFGSALAFGTALHFMPIFTRARGLASYTPFFVAYVLSAIFIRFTAGGLGDRLGHRRVGAIGLAVFAVVVASLATVETTPMLAVAGIVFGASHGLVYPSLNASFIEKVGVESRGRAIAGFNLAFNLGMTLAAFVGGEVAERLGYGAMWLVAAAVAAVGVMALALGRRPV